MYFNVRPKRQKYIIGGSIALLVILLCVGVFFIIRPGEFKTNDQTVLSRPRHVALLPVASLEEQTTLTKERLEEPDESEDINADSTTEPVYDIKVFGVDDEIRDSYGGAFVEEDFLKALTRVIRPEQDTSAYADVKTVTFLKDKYETDNTDIVGYFIVFNEDANRKNVVLFSKANKKFTFSLNYKTATPIPTPIPIPTQVPITTPVPQPQEPVQVPQKKPDDAEGEGDIETSFQLNNMPTQFLDFVGGQDEFFSVIYNHVVSVGHRHSVGTFQEYMISGDDATFLITLNNGAKVRGVYNKTTKNYIFE